VLALNALVCVLWSCRSHSGSYREEQRDCDAIFMLFSSVFSEAGLCRDGVVMDTETPWSLWIQLLMGGPRPKKHKLTLLLFCFPAMATVSVVTGQKKTYILRPTSRLTER